MTSTQSEHSYQEKWLIHFFHQKIFFLIALNIQKCILFVGGGGGAWHQYFDKFASLTVMAEIDFCHIMTGHGLQALADVWPRCDREVTTQKDLWPRCDQTGLPVTDLWPRCDKSVTTLTDLQPRCNQETILTDLWPRCDQDWPTERFVSVVGPICNHPDRFLAEVWPICDHPEDLLLRCDHPERFVVKVGPIYDRFLAEIRQTPHTVRSHSHFCAVLRHGLIHECFHSVLQNVCDHSVLQYVYVYSMLHQVRVYGFLQYVYVCSVLQHVCVYSVLQHVCVHSVLL